MRRNGQTAYCDHVVQRGIPEEPRRPHAAGHRADTFREETYPAKASFPENENLSGIDRALTDLVVQNPRHDGRVAGMTNYQLYGVFSYKGETYFDRWNDADSGDERESVTRSIYEAKGGTTRTLCQMKDVQVRRWSPGKSCAFRHCPPAKPFPVSLTP